MKKIVTLIAIILGLNAFAQTNNVKLRPDRDVVDNPSNPAARPCGATWSGWVGDCFVIYVKCVNVGGTTIIKSCKDGVTVSLERMINSNGNNGNGPKTINKGNLSLEFMYEEGTDIINGRMLENSSLITIENDITATIDNRQVTLSAGTYHLINKKLLVEGTFE